MKDCALTLVYSLDKSKILLVKRGDVPVWVLPGGGIEEGESPEEAAIRETEEESGLKIHLKRRAATYHPKNYFTRLTYLFESFESTGFLKTSFESKEVAFFSLDQLPQSLFPLHELWIKKTIASPNEMIEEDITQVTLWQIAKYFLKHPLQVVRFIYTRLTSF
ncbi:NUDIX domain-containing protein [Chlamydiales bacterium]|nr:NUDIX domain-containing protein [Chlamydiales bacterium]